MITSAQIFNLLTLGAIVLCALYMCKSIQVYQLTQHLKPDATDLPRFQDCWPLLISVVALYAYKQQFLIVLAPLARK